MSNNEESSFFRGLYPLLKELNRQPQSAADQILSVRSERKHAPPVLIWIGITLQSLIKELWSPFPVCAYVCGRPHSPFLLHMDQYSWHVLPLCRINSGGEKKQPLTASVHTAFLRHCMKIDGFDIISKASLSHMPAVEGTGWDQLPPSILAFAMIQGVCFHLRIHLLLYFNSDK